MLSDITTFLSSLWGIFTDVQVPLLGISFAQLWLGIFVVGVATIILRPLLGIGAGTLQNVASAGRRVASSARHRSEVRRRERAIAEYRERMLDAVKNRGK